VQCYLISAQPTQAHQDKYPSRLHSLLRSSYFEEPRKGGLGKYFDKSKIKVGEKLIQNRLNYIRKIDRPLNDAKMSNASIRILLKDTYLLSLLFLYILL